MYNKYMTITVYWANTEKEWMLAQEPEPVAKIFYNKHKNLSAKDPNQAISRCPAFGDRLNNLYAIKSIYDYQFTLNPNGQVTSNMKSQQFFNEHVIIRSIEERMFSFMQRYVFFTEEDSLLTTFYEFPVYEDNNITKRCQPVSGSFDIGKWFRNSEFAFFLNKEYDTFIVDQGEVYMYLRFHTKEKIKFKQFRSNENIISYMEDGFALNTSDGTLGNLQNYYKHFKHKKLILKEIKNNLL
jgi:hypothetical protein